ncbi:MAG: hypothetical protein RMJ97_03400 [Raineya sp.]|nr:hypothetical protein [Raineya sp.]
MGGLMEQLYWWSLATLLWSGWQVLRQVVRLEAHKLAQFKRILAYQFFYFLSSEYKLTFTILASALVLLATGNAVKDNVLQTFFWLNVAWWLLQVFTKELPNIIPRLSNYLFFKIFWEGSPFSAVGIIGALCINSYLLYFYQGFFGDITLLLALLASTFLGTSIVFWAFRFGQYCSGLHPAPLQNPYISNERLDLWLVVLISCLVLAQMYGNKFTFVILPILVTSVILVTAFIAKQHKHLQIAMIVFQVMFIFILIYAFLPDFWLKNGTCYYRSDLLVILIISLLISVFADKIIAFYQFLQEKYTVYFVKKPVFHVWVTYILRGLITLTITSLLAWGVLFAFQKVELYGMSLSLLVIFSNIHTKISFDVPIKWK